MNPYFPHSYPGVLWASQTGQLHRFQCPLCFRVLSSKQNFKEHTYIHTGEKPFRCEECKECFRQGSQLSVHKRIHKAMSHGAKEAEVTFIPKVIATQLTDLLLSQNVPHPPYSFSPGPLKPASEFLPPLNLQNYETKDTQAYFLE